MRLLTFAVCPTCGKRFHRYGAEAQKRIYCCVECSMRKAVAPKVVSFCVECGCPFERKASSPQRFCSKQCSDNSSLSKRCKPRECPICGTVHKSREFAEYCSERCIDIAIAIEN